MLSIAVTGTRNRPSLLAPLAAAASVGTAIFSNRNEDLGDDTAKKVLDDNPPLNDWRLKLCSIDTAILSNARFNIPMINQEHCSCESPFAYLSRRETLRWLDKTSSNATLESRYKVDWKNPLGEGGYGAVYMCTNRITGERHALKKMPKKYTDNESFQREIVALLRVRESGSSHPNICELKENFEENDNYYLVLDLITGGEMFDHLAQNGPYSEADAAHLVRETASALAFIHGVGLVHGDLKPENLLLSTRNISDSVIKLVDFGCAEIYKGQSSIKKNMTRSNVANTPAYSPPEAFSKWQGPLHPSFDMFSMGLILYIMLTGHHPYDIHGTSTDKEIERRIKMEIAPLRDSPMTAHLSDSAIDLLEKLLDKRPQRRMTAMDMLEHPWVKGLTAEKKKMEGSNTKLSHFRKFKSRLEVKIFTDWVSSATGNGDDVNVKSGLVEREFRKFDVQNGNKGYLTAKDLGKTLTGKNKNQSDDENSSIAPLSLSEFTDLISDHFVNKFYPEGYKVYREGSKGNTIYFINSGTVEISTKAGFKTTLSQGQFFGEGALLSGTGERNASVTCVTPVHVIAISKEYFNKYMIESGSEINMTLQELTRSRDRDQAIQMLRHRKNLFERDFLAGDVLFSCGEDGRSIFILDEGEINIIAKNGKHVLTVMPGAICGEHSLIMNQPRNVTAVCASDICKVREMAANDFYALYNSSPRIKQSLREFCLRRDFMKAIVDILGEDFGTSEDELHKVYDMVDSDVSGEIELKEVKGLIKRIYPHLSDDDPLFTEVLHSLDIDSSNTVKWEEFKKVFLNSKSSKLRPSYKST